MITCIKLYTDGACRPNPGYGAIGIVILDQDDNELETHKEILGRLTNNHAEYNALIKGLDFAAKHCRTKVVCHLDSEIVVNQMNGAWRLRDDKLRQLFREVKDMERSFDKVIYTYVSQDNQYIKQADRLSKQALSDNY